MVAWIFLMSAALAGWFVSGMFAAQYFGSQFCASYMSLYEIMQLSMLPSQTVSTSLAQSAAACAYCCAWHDWKSADCQHCQGTWLVMVAVPSAPMARSARIDGAPW